jgi:hypothetical protein
MTACTIAVCDSSSMAHQVQNTLTLHYTHTTQIYNSQRTVNVGDSAMKQKLVDEARRRIVVPYREVSCCCYCYCML